jgi:hypothetical protein
MKKGAVISPMARILRHFIALVTSVGVFHLFNGVVLPQLVWIFGSYIPIEWYPTGTILSSGGYYLALYVVLWPFMLLVPSAVLFESRFIFRRIPSNLVLQSLIFGFAHLLLALTLTEIWWPFFLDNLELSIAVFLTAASYWCILGLLTLTGVLENLKERFISKTRSKVSKAA